MVIGLTGGSGFIGTHFVQEYMSRDDFIRILDIAPPPIKYPADRVHYIQGDIRDKNCAKEFCQGLDCIIHLAAAHHDFGVSREVFYDVNQNGTRSICNAASQSRIQKIVFFSSVAVYDPSGAQITESTLPSPVNDYGASKLAAESEILSWAKAEAVRSAVIIRPAVVFGPGNKANMYNLISQIAKGRYLFNFGNGRNIKSLVYVKNLVDFVLFLLDHPTAAQNTVEIFNYIDSPQLTIRETIETIHQSIDKPMPRVTIPLSAALGFGKIFDLAIAFTGKNLPISSKRILKIATATRFEAPRIASTGFIPVVGLQDGIREMIRWYLSLAAEERQSG